MDARIRDLLKPEVLNSVNGLELVARILVEGFMSGSNKSQSIGIGQEFAQYRTYEAGDDLRQLDWKMYARSERYFIKQAEIETNITVKFMVDASQSMAYEENGISKLQFARVIVAALAYLARKQGDTFGLFIVNDRELTAVQPRFEQQQFIRFLYALIQATAQSRWNRNDIEQLFDHHGKEMIVFVTDLYDHDGDIRRFIYRLKTSRNEVIVLHMLGEKELTLEWDGSFTFRDMETGATVKVDTKAQKEQYVARVGKWINELRMSLLEKSIHYFNVSMGDPVDATLRSFLKARKNLKS